jgi:hypothetical protein
MKTATQTSTAMSALLKDVYLGISWSKIADQAFPDKSMGWFFNKMHGRDGNGGKGEFTYAEKIQLRNALLDFSGRISQAAMAIDI